MIVVLDDEKRENEGDLIMAADKITPADVEFLRKHTSGYICVGMEGTVLDRLELPLMVSSAENDEAMYTAFTVTVDAREGISTGISAEDRARTLRLLADPAASAADFRRPGHINPLRSQPGGVLTRPGHTEAAVDMCRLAGCQPAGALCEIVNPEDGSMSRTPELLEFAARHGLRCITIAELVRYRMQHDGYQATATNGAASL
ncbi:3,4-dihydroxy-2-butanone 4-phosphate synthase [Coccomyxa subellipsoidea C-169]|uniref:3,4-dihydroxy-2-butanone 4-phosphate synthase n=1 Tax=Coccomyxa subellipsoidea (strain C-169) TaxID=574566 RepID=I0Z8H3_COCSC|nr:3,4-dihydroxy-2-butanone 4-phosphate synthase [Coccomyxa subellipsoidea C-169]EIE26942.1 3,4-dihydroxy-2-butanone 4-phosphate synthase [Coccomyxa subellipsoidea C-169]|eukprot:XP_005651486.1 3,4-dihydroxy-2-butanone 4-phosphate synthase [Coccomyxa subellipsoidea C-169]